LIEDFEHLAIDQEGVLICEYPFISLKELPKIYLGSEEKTPIFNQKPMELLNQIGKPLESKFLKVGYELLSIIETSHLYPQMKKVLIDTSYAFDPSLGRQEVILSFLEIVQNEGRIVEIPWQLRLNPKKLKFQWNLFLQVKNQVPKSNKGIDSKGNDSSVNESKVMESKVMESRGMESRVIDLRMDRLILIPKN